MKHVSIHITGKVQGVFFRASTKEKADEFAIKGTVRNNGDGTVSVQAEGDDAAIDKFIEWCRQGPPNARVEHCEVVDIVSSGNFKNFSIVR